MPKAKQRSEKLAIRSRPPLERMMHIHQAIQAGTYPNATRLANELEVSTKSIQRDIEFMRDRMELPLSYDRAHFGYFYTEEVGAFPTLQMTEGELFALVVAEKALQQYRGTSFEKPLVSAFKKMASSLPETISVNFDSWDQTISFHTSAEPIIDLNIFELLSKATTEQVQIEFEYRKPSAKRPESRTVDPYHLANINGEWFLFGFCHLRKDLRTFAPARIASIRRTKHRFKRPAKFSLDQRLRKSFGVIPGNQSYKVVVQFDELTSTFIREKKWHASQKLKNLPHGGVELTLELSSLIEVQRWILGWGASAKVIAPNELAEAVTEAAKSIVASSEQSKKTKRQQILRRPR